MLNITIAIRALLMADSELMSLLGNDESRIVPSYIDSVIDPKFPLITISQSSGGRDERDLAEDTEKNIDVWSKVDSDELDAIYQRIRFCLHKKSLPGILTYLLREVPHSVRDDLYEASTQTHHLTSRYRAVTA